MIIVGLTGSIAMGKSTVAAMLKKEGLPVHDADATVHDLMAPGGAAHAQIKAEFNNVTTADGLIDRQALGRAVFGDQEKRAALEAILHPLVKQHRHSWLEEQKSAGHDIVILDIPLLYETGSDQDCDAVMVVSASPRQQRQRALARPEMTAEKFAAILNAQMPDHEKRSRADFVIPTAYGETASLWHLRRVIKALKVTNHA